jgi:hypothetical protein
MFFLCDGVLFYTCFREIWGRLIHQRWINCSFLVHSFITFRSFCFEDLTNPLFASFFIIITSRLLMVRFVPCDYMVLVVWLEFWLFVIVPLSYFNKLLNDVHIGDLWDASLMFLQLQVHKWIIFQCMVINFADLLHILIVGLVVPSILNHVQLGLFSFFLIQQF